MDWLHSWYNHVAGIVPPSTALAFFTKTSEKGKCTSPFRIQVKNMWKTISTGEKLDVISWLENSKQIVDICHNVRFTYSTIRTIHDNADRIRESIKSGTEVFVYQDYHSPIRMNHTKTLWMWVSYILLHQK